MAARHRLGDFSYSDHHPPSFHFHDFDHHVFSVGVPKPGRRALSRKDFSYFLP
jgi:hypothetical protein